jgi:hypothetical protein
MAFLDNSGDIILDAVLTDLGRKRLAEGNFRITQFALGDDEIDYSLYDKDHPSGSAYYDLEILQTPVFEAFTQTNANINYGLLSLNGNPNVLYVPSLTLNEKTDETGKGVKLYNNVMYLAVNSETSDALKGSGAIGNADQVALATSNMKVAIFETGIQNNGDPAGTKDNKDSYITNNGLIDNQLTLKCDHRFLDKVYPIARGSVFNYRSGDASAEIVINIVASPLAPSAGENIDNQRMYVLPSIPNNVEDQTGTSTPATDVSSINGPRGVATAFHLGVPADLQAVSTAVTPAKYSLYGKTAQNLFGDGNTYDYIDTVAYLNGNTTGANTQLVVRIIRRAS